MACVRCGNGATRWDGHTRLGGQRWRCARCGRRFTGRSTSACSGHWFPDDVIALAVRWDARCRLRDADVAECLAARGVTVDRTALSRWVQRVLPLCGAAARRHRPRVGKTWRVDETYCDCQGKHAYSYRAIDEHGQVVDA